MLKFSFSREEREGGKIYNFKSYLLKWKKKWTKNNWKRERWLLNVSFCETNKKYRTIFKNYFPSLMIWVDLLKKGSFVFKRSCAMALPWPTQTCSVGMRYRDLYTNSYDKYSLPEENHQECEICENSHYPS